MLGWVLAATVGPGPAVDIDWTAPETCPTRDVLINELEAYLDHDAAAQSDRVDQVKATIEQSEDGWKLHLRAQVEGGVLERTLQADRCELLGKAAALMISVLVHPTAVVETIEEAKAEPKPPPESPPPPEPPPLPEPMSNPNWLTSIRLGVDGGLGAGLLPGIGGELSAHVGIAFPYLRVELVGGYSTARQSLYSDAALEAAQIDPQDAGDIGASIAAWSLGGRACGVPHRHRLRVPLCAALSAGSFVADGLGLAEPRRATPNVMAVSGRAGVEYELLPQLLLNLSGDLIVPLLRPSFSVADVGPLHTTGSIAGGVSVGLAAEFAIGGARK